LKGEICTGDILSNLNGVEINSSCKGRLNAIFRANKGKPINLVVVKAFHKQSQDVFAPVKTILEKLQIDPVKITNRSQSEHTTETATCAPKSTKSGYSATYLGLVSVGNNGSVRQIEEAIKRRLSMTKSDTQKPVIFEIGEMNIKVLDSETGGVSCAATGRLHKLKHQFSDRF
jgi:tRNA/tmRNA/rRNA uracil-C5-methylase (TrmA/RlmC/RlmD family)